MLFYSGVVKDTAGMDAHCWLNSINTFVSKQILVNFTHILSINNNAKSLTLVVESPLFPMEAGPGLQSFGPPAIEWAPSQSEFWGGDRPSGGLVKNDTKSGL